MLTPILWLRGLRANEGGTELAAGDGWGSAQHRGAFTDQHQHAGGQQQTEIDDDGHLVGAVLVEEVAAEECAEAGAQGHDGEHGAVDGAHVAHAETVGGVGSGDADDGVPRDSDGNHTGQQGCEAEGGDVEQGYAHGQEDDEEAESSQVVGEAEELAPSETVGEVAEEDGADDGPEADEAEAGCCHHLRVSEVLEVGDEVSIHEAH